MLPNFRTITRSLLLRKNERACSCGSLKILRNLLTMINLSQLLTKPLTEQQRATPEGAFIQALLAFFDNVGGSLTEKPVPRMAQLHRKFEAQHPTSLRVPRAEFARLFHQIANQYLNSGSIDSPRPPGVCSLLRSKSARPVESSPLKTTAAFFNLRAPQVPSLYPAVEKGEFFCSACGNLTLAWRNIAMVQRPSYLYKVLVCDASDSKRCNQTLIHLDGCSCSPSCSPKASRSSCTFATQK